MLLLSLRILFMLRQGCLTSGRPLWLFLRHKVPLEPLRCLQTASFEVRRVSLQESLEDYWMDPSRHPAISICFDLYECDPDALHPAEMCYFDRGKGRPYCARYLTRLASDTDLHSSCCDLHHLLLDDGDIQLLWVP